MLIINKPLKTVSQVIANPMLTVRPIIGAFYQTKPGLTLTSIKRHRKRNEKLQQILQENSFVNSFNFIQIRRIHIRGKIETFTEKEFHFQLPFDFFSCRDSAFVSWTLKNHTRSFSSHNYFNSNSYRHFRFLKMVDSVSDMIITPCEKSKYIKPLRLHYKQNGLPKTWDVIKNHDSVCVLLFNRKREVFVFVKQFRPIIYMNRSETYEEDGVTKIDSSKFSGKLGVTTELCAGIVDKNLSLQEIVQEEILEECGYKIPLDNIERVVSYRGGVSTTGACATLFYAEISDEMKVGQGGGVEEEGERIDLIEVPVSEAKALVMDESIPKPSGIMFAVFWFFDTKWKK